MKYLILITALTVALPARAEQVRSTVTDHYSYVTERVPRTQRECFEVDVPVYGDRTRSGNSAEGALLGMILGGVIGKGITGENDGAAVGAVMGGVIGADQGSKPKTERVVTGYRSETQCNDITYNEEVNKRVYSHSTVSFRVNGQNYTLNFIK